MPMRLLFALGSLASLGSAVTAPTTCGGLKESYRSNTCCGNPTKAVTIAPACPYNFAKPACSVAEPQAPRDLSTGATGAKTPKAATLTVAQASMLPLANVHFHLGAEHKSDEYNVATDQVAYDAAQHRRLLEEPNWEEDGPKVHYGDDIFPRRLVSNPRPGLMCQGTLTTQEQTAYTFQHCHNVVVGKTYEIHYVHSSAGYHQAEHAAIVDIDGMDDGLGGAANGRGQLNPMLAVQALVVQVVNDQSAPTVSDLLHGWGGVTHTSAVMYPGSTTGTSHTDSICSPYAVTWHVDKQCHKVAAASFDNMCLMMKNLYNLDGDLYPHGSRSPVNSQYVVTNAHVLPLA